jgi:hypothetical protein
MDVMRLPALVVTLATGIALASPPAPLARFNTDAGFIDDAFALRPDGKAIAYLTTDGATSATLHIAELASAASELKVEGAPADAQAIYWLGPNRVLIVSGQPDQSVAQSFAASGAEKMRLGPFGQLALATLDGKSAIMTETERDREHLVAAYRLDDLKPIARRSLRENGDGQLLHAKGPLKPLWWSNGFTQLAALRLGEYDKAHDIRRPDRLARLDVFTGKLLDEREITDVLEFARVAGARKSAPNQPVIVHFSDDHRRLLLVDDLVERELALPGLGNYDATTLAWQILDERHLAVSLTVDPVNPEAVKHHKADPDQFDLYEVDRQSGAASLRLQLLADGRRSSWRIVGDRLALLRKSKGFGRGGVALEIYSLSTREPAATR